MGLLGNDFNDPQTSGILALAGNMVRGDFGSGLLGFNQAYQGTQDALLKRQDLAQQIQMRNIALQQQQQEWAMQMPLLKAMSERMQGGGQPAQGAMPSQPATMPTQGGALGSGTFGIPTGGQPATAPQQRMPQGGGMFPGIPDNVALPTAAFGGMKALLPLMSKYNEPTELMKTLTATGAQPGSPEWNQALQASVRKSNYIAPVNARPGSILRDPNTNMPIAFNPHIPDGATPSFDAGGNVVGLRQIDGALPAISAAETAKAMGTAEATPTVAYDASGRPVFSTKATDVRRTQPLTLPGDGDRTRILQAESVAAQQRLTQLQSDPRTTPEVLRRAQDDVTGIGREMQRSSIPTASGGVTPVPQLGAQQGATLSQNELSTKGASLMADNANASTVISRLQNIKMLAPGAITGAESSRRDFFNGLLSLAGIKGAADSKTASDLVDKNQAQIVSALRMGQGGAGTDALQTLLGSANPNRHMTNDAIQEAADQLIASQKMIQDKAKLLQPHMLNRDPVSYGQKEMAFDQNADPRVWQLQSMPPQQQAAYVRTLTPEMAAEMLKKRKTLKQLGVF